MNINGKILHGLAPVEDQMSNYQLDFAKIKEEHSVESVAERLGLELKKSGSQLRGHCPSGEGDERAFVITPAKRAWYSFAAQTGGDCIKLVEFVNKVSAKEAAAWIANPSTVPEKKTADKPSEGFKPLDYLDPDHPAVEAVGFAPDDAKRIGVGFCPRGILKGTVAVPVRDEAGKLLGYVGITEAKLPGAWRW